MHPFSREALLLCAAVLAVAVAFGVGHIAHFDLGLSRDAIRTGALGGAAAIAAALFAGTLGGRRRGD